MFKVKVRGGTRMKQLGKTQLNVWLEEEQAKTLTEMADKLFISKAEVLRRLLKAAQRLPELLTGHGLDSVWSIVLDSRKPKPAIPATPPAKSKPKPKRKAS